MSEGPFLGKHREQVASLVDRLMAIREGADTNRIVLLSAPSGTGKSRIIREFYHQLASEQETEYWPSLASVTRCDGASLDPMPNRKVISPPLSKFRWPENTLPSFGWWSFNCEQLASGQTHDLVAAGQQQWQTHGVALAIAKRGLDSPSLKIKEKFRQGVDEARKAIVDEGSDAAVDLAMEALGIAIPGAGTILGWGWSAVTAMKNKKHERSLLAENVDLGKQHNERQFSAAEALAALIKENALPGLPAIVVVEDLHLMSSELGHLLNLLATPDPKHPVLVIGTVWPESNGRPDYKQWRDSADDFVDERQVHPLSPSELCRLIQLRAPRTSVETACQVTAHLSTPFAVNLWLSLPPVERHIKLNNGALNPSPTDIRNLRHVLQTVHDSRWNELNDVEQLCLAIAEAVTPLASDPLRTFVPEVIAEVAAGIGEFPIEKARSALSRTIDPYTWCRRENEKQSFIEESLTQAVFRNRSSVLLEADVSAARSKAFDSVARILDMHQVGISLPRTPEVDLLADWYDAWPRDRKPNDQTWIGVQELLADRAADNRKFAEAVQKSDRILRFADQAPTEALDFFNNLAVRNAIWVASTGNTSEALSRFSRLAQSVAKQRNNREHHDVQIVKSYVSRILWTSGQKDSARSLQQEVVRGLAKTLGEEHPRTLKEAQYAAFLGAGNPSDISRLRDATLKNAEKGNLSEDAKLFEMMQLLSAEVRSGNTEKLDEFKLLYEKFKSNGTSSSNMLIDSLNQIGRLHMQLSQFELAVDYLEDALDSARKELGESDDITAMIKMNLASCHGQLGDTVVAGNLLAEVYLFRYEKFGEDDLRTLNTLFLIGKNYSNNEEWNLASTTLSRVRELRIKMLGKTDKDTLLAIREAAYVDFMRGGRESVSSIEEVLRIQINTLGADHRHVHSTRQILADLGDYAE